MLRRVKDCAPSVDQSLVNMLGVGPSFGEHSMGVSLLLHPGEAKSLVSLRDWASRRAALTMMSGSGQLSAHLVMLSMNMFGLLG